MEIQWKDLWLPYRIAGEEVWGKGSIDFGLRRARSHRDRSEEGVQKNKENEGKQPVYRVVELSSWQ